jgi:putative ABC transport system permease protein
LFPAMKIKELIPDIFSLKTAWRDARAQYKSLFLYSSGIIAGVTALVAILSFRSDVFLTVEDQARELLGADLELRQNHPYNDEVTAFIDSLGGTQSTVIEFSSMVVYGESGETRLSQIRAIEGGFPFYGRLKTEPENAAFEYQEQRSALVDRPIMNQLNLSVGDSIRVGEEKLLISGVIHEIPGESAAFSLIGPRVIIPREVVEGTTLLQRGSRVRYKTYFQFEPERDIEALVADMRPFAREEQLRYETVESRKEDFAQIVDNLTRFLGMIGFIALLLGGLGVASAIYVYIKKKSPAVATLRCLGASSRQTTQIFALQVFLLGLAGAFIGSLLGLMVQRYLPGLFTDFLPFEIIQQVSVPALLLGFGIGVIVSIGFAMLPLMSINKIPPLLTLRNVDFNPLDHISVKTKIMGGVLVIVIITASLALLLENLIASFLFTIGLILSILLLLGTANLLIRTVRAMRLRSLPYIWRQGIANLFRPNNQTSILVTTLGMGMLLIGVLYLSQDMILQRIDFQTGDQQPDLVLYDIQSDQNDDILRIVEESGATVLQNVPIVTMRLSHRKGVPIREVREDTTLNVRGWALSREYRVTYRDHLTEAETITQGEWIGESEGIGSLVPISIHDAIASDLDITVGDSLTFDIQGIPVDTYIASIRDVDFQRPEPNFFVLFPAGVLESAPQFYATVLRTDGQVSAINLQQLVVQEHPNISAIDIGLVLESIQQFLDKVAMAVQFMALFSIITGLIVLASAIAISRYQRIREAVLLRTIGASRIQIRGIQLLEYLLLGLLACFTGLILSIGSAWLLSLFYFELPFSPNLTALFMSALFIVILTMLVGLANMQGVLNRKPLEVLRMGTG